MASLLEIAGPYATYFIALLLTLPRLYAFLGASQLLNASAVPGLPRVAAILVLAIVAVPITLEHATAFDRTVLAFSLYFAKEYAIGFLAGHVVGRMFWVVQAVGGLIDSQRGTAIAASIDPLQGEESSSLGNLLSQAFLTYIFTTGGFLLVLGVLYRSYALWPATRALPIIAESFPAMFLGLLDSAMRLAFVSAAPILAIMFLAEFALAIISRFAPQIQVFVLAMPIKSMIAILVLIFYFSRLLPFADQQLASVEGQMRQLYGILTSGDRIELPRRTTPPVQP